MLGVVVVGWSSVAVGVAVVSYAARAFGITAFYHRCFSHRAFQVPRAVQLAGATLGAAARSAGRCGGWRTIVPTTASTNRAATRTRRS